MTMTMTGPLKKHTLPVRKNTRGKMLRPILFSVLLCGASIVHAATPKVVTLGDSFSAGAGYYTKDEQYDDVACLREVDSTPGPRLAKSRNNTESVFLACSGAVIKTVSAQFDTLNELYPVDKNGNWTGSTILMTAGGNNLVTRGGSSWFGIVMNCLTKRGCDRDTSNEIGNFDLIEANLTAFLTRVAFTANQATIRIFGYAKLMHPNLSCRYAPLFTKDEANWFDNVVVDLNQRIATAVQSVQQSYPSVDLKYVDVDKYLTVGACSYRNRHVRGIAWTSKGMSGSSFHPTPLGYEKYYQALLDSL